MMRVIAALPPLLVGSNTPQIRAAKQLRPSAICALTMGPTFNGRNDRHLLSSSLYCL